MPNIGPLEVGLVLIICLIIFGPRRLPEFGRSLGGGLRGFKDSLTGADEASPEAGQLASQTDQSESKSPEG